MTKSPLSDLILAHSSTVWNTGGLIDDDTAENTQAAESRIRDTDMASEFVDQSIHGILQQAGESMLAQANQISNEVLKLLQ